MAPLIIATVFLSGVYLWLGLRHGFLYIYNCYLFAALLFVLILGTLGNTADLELYSITLPVFTAITLHSLMLAGFSFIKASERILFILPGLFFLGVTVFALMILISSATSGFRMIG